MNAILGKAGKRLFEKHLEQYSPPDPLYEFYTNEKGKKKRRKRALPPGLSARDAKILKSVQRRAHYLDKGFSILGFRFGWTFLIGLIPIAGDAANATLNYLLVVRKARKADIPPWLLRRMFFNNLVSAGVGFVPLVGDVILAVYKANSRNAALLEELLRIRGEEYLKLQEGAALVSSDNNVKGAKKKAVSKKDAEQIKPGAGIMKGEVIPTEPMVSAMVSATPSTTAVVSEKQSAPTRSGSTGKKPFGLFGTGGKSKANASAEEKAPPPGEMGRFIEDVGPANTR